MNVLLSIKPEFGEQILSGEKRYEFRKTGFRDPDLVDTVIMYASAPVQKIIGCFTIGDVVESSPNLLWERFGSESGIDEERFKEYFAEKDTGYAIHVNQPRRFSTPIDPWTHIEEFRPPVSFEYVDDEFDFILDGKPAEGFVSD